MKLVLALLIIAELVKTVELKEKILKTETFYTTIFFISELLCDASINYEKFSSYLAVDRRAKCAAIYQTLLRREKQFFGAQDSLIYDLASILYSLQKLPFSKSSGDEVEIFQNLYMIECCM